MDTIEANLALGFKEDLREYSIAVHMLRDLGVKSIELLTNNPLKIDGLSKYGMEVTKRRSIQVEATAYDLFYLKTKQMKMGHMLNY